MEFFSSQHGTSSWHRYNIETTCDLYLEISIPCEIRDDIPDKHNRWSAKPAVFSQWSMTTLASDVCDLHASLAQKACSNVVSPLSLPRNTRLVLRALTLRNDGNDTNGLQSGLIYAMLVKITPPSLESVSFAEKTLADLLSNNYLLNHY